MKSILRYSLNVGISLLILYFIFTKVSFAQIAGILKQSDSREFSVAVVLGIASLFVSAWRWQILLNVIGHRHGLGLLSRLSFMSFLYNNFLPGGVVGEVARIAMLPGVAGSPEERKIHLTRVTASVVTDRVVGMIGIMLLAFLGFIASRHLLQDRRILVVFVLLTSGIAAVFAVLFSRRIQGRVKTLFAAPLRILSPVQDALRNVTESLFVYRDNYGVFLKVIPLSVLSNVCVVGYFYYSARAIDIPIGFFRLLLFVPFIEFISTIPVTLSGVGIREAATIVLFASEGYTAAQAIAVSLLTFVILLILGAIGGVCFLLRWARKSSPTS